jgi:multidrug efflux pump subunit AcrA (membrane-fusion protein)
MLLKSGDDILDISDKSQVQVLANVFQRDSTWLKTGIKAELFLRYSPGESWSGYVTQDTVRSSASTRNISSRLVFELPKGKVKSGTQVRTRIHGETHKDALVIPSESLIYTESEVRVVLALGEGRFQPVEVVIGMESNGYTEVLDGLKKGDKVVSSSQFLIDSESQLISSFKRLQGN